MPTSSFVHICSSLACDLIHRAQCRAPYCAQPFSTRTGTSRSASLKLYRQTNAHGRCLKCKTGAQASAELSPLGEITHGA